MPRHLEEQQHDDDPGRHPGRDANGDPGDQDEAADQDGAAPSPAAAAAATQRVQTGVRMEKRLVKVLKALAELYDRSLGDLLEGIVLHAFAGRSPFSADSLRRIAELERIYGLDVAARAGQRPLEPGEPRP
jgi:hypothetical protein